MVYADDERPNQCYLCGAEATERDHVPPKSLFSKPRPDLITVPSCTTCNREASRDEEYFRVMVCMASPANAAAREVFIGPVRRGLQSKQRFLGSILRATIRRVGVRSRGGIILGHQPAVRVEKDRIQRVINKIVRGLFYYHLGRMLRADYRVLDFCRNIDLNSEDFSWILSLPIYEIGKDVFCYRFGIAEHDPDKSAWAMMFYTGSLFVTMTGPKLPLESNHLCPTNTDENH